MKNNIVNIFVFVLIINMILTIIPDTVHAPASDYEYIEYHEKAMITGYTGSGGSIEIPETIGGLQTGYISENAFNSDKGHLITSVIIPNSVIEIWSKAFYSCTQLQSITIGSGVTTIGNDVFQYCSNLKNINFMMQNPPEVCDCWVDNTSDTLRGHALIDSNFPAPGEIWEAGNLIMGEYINIPPIADFSYNPSHPTEWDDIQFTDESTDSDGTVISWNWDFGDGDTSTQQHPNHQYDDDGIYTVTLTVTDDRGATDSTTKVLYMSNNKPYAKFTYNPTSPTKLEDIQFTDESPDTDGTVVSWNWDFGDGDTSIQQHPKHKYADNGIYTVTLTVTDDDGANDSTSTDIIVGGDNIPPIADFTYSPSSPTKLEVIQFTDTSTDPDGSIVIRNWNFGDNTNSTSSEKTIQHIYTAAGTYQVILTVTDNNGATNTKKTSIIIKGNNPPTQPKIIGPTSGHKNNLYNFTVTSSDPENDTIQYKITWGDENSYVNTSTFLPSNTPFTCGHRWTTPGAYQIRVGASDNKTDSTYAYHTILIDIKYIDTYGYFINLTGNNDYEMFYSNDTMKKTNVQKQSNGIYLIDIDGNGNWDHIYDSTKGFTTYQTPTKTPGFGITLIISAITIALLLQKKNRKK